MRAILAIMFCCSAFSFGEAQAEPSAETIALGKTLTEAADCASCHTIPDSNRSFAGGRAIETPFGNIVAPNITPDLETGIGSWSDDAFDAAIRKGLRRNGSRPAQRARSTTGCRSLHLLESQTRNESTWRGLRIWRRLARPAPRLSGGGPPADGRGRLHTALDRWRTGQAPLMRPKQEIWICP